MYHEMRPNLVVSISCYPNPTPTCSTWIIYTDDVQVIPIQLGTYGHFTVRAGGPVDALIRLCLVEQGHNSPFVVEDVVSNKKKVVSREQLWE